MKSFRTAIAIHLDYFVFLRLRVSTISEGTYYLQKRRLLRPIFCLALRARLSPLVSLSTVTPYAKVTALSGGVPKNASSRRTRKTESPDPSCCDPKTCPRSSPPDHPRFRRTARPLDRRAKRRLHLPLRPGPRNQSGNFHRLHRRLQLRQKQRKFRPGPPAEGSR